MTSLQPLWKAVWGILRKLKIELPHDPAIPLLELYPKETKTLTRKDTYTSMFVTALFTIAKTWKQPKYPSMDEWIKKLWYVYIYVYIPHTYTHTMGYYSVIKKTHTKNEEILPFLTKWMGREGIMLSKISQTEKDKNFMIPLICGISNKQTHRKRDQICGY